MMWRENSEQQWFECTACGAAMDGDEIDAAQQVLAASGHDPSGYNAGCKFRRPSPALNLAEVADPVATVGAQASDVAPEEAPAKTKATGAKKVPTGEPRTQRCAHWQ